PAVRGDSGADRPAAAGVCLGVRLAALDKAVRTSSSESEGRTSGRLRAMSEGEASCALGSGGDGVGTGGALWEKSLQPFLRVGNLSGGVAAEAPRDFIWERSVKGACRESKA